MRVDLKLFYRFKIAEVESFQKLIDESRYLQPYKKIVDYVYPQLRSNPFFGPNIKKLKGELEDFYRYRIGKYRLFYKIDKQRVIVFVISLKHRGEAY